MPNASLTCPPPKKNSCKFILYMARGVSFMGGVQCILIKFVASLLFHC